MALQFDSLDLKAEKAVLTNTGSADVNLKGFVLADLSGGNLSAPLKACVVAAGASVTIWTCPGKERGLKEGGGNVFWRNKGNKKPRSKGVLNDDGDGLRLLDAAGTEVARIEDTPDEPSAKPAQAAQAEEETAVPAAADPDVEMAAEDPVEEAPPTATAPAASSAAEDEGEAAGAAAGTGPLSLKERFALLKRKREFARKMNEEEVVAEDRRAKLPAGYEKRKRKAEWELEDERKRKEAEEKGLDYNRIKRLNTRADEEGRRRNKQKNKLTGHDKMCASIKPDMELYQKTQKAWSDFGAQSLEYGQHADITEITRAGVDRMVASVENEQKKRSEYSRRRAFNEDADVDYINKRNMVFNKKVARFYNKYTQDIKDSLERGTAL